MKNKEITDKCKICKQDFLYCPHSIKQVNEKIQNMLIEEVVTKVLKKHGLIK